MEEIRKELLKLIIDCENMEMLELVLRCARKLLK